MTRTRLWNVFTVAVFFGLGAGCGGGGGSSTYSLSGKVVDSADAGVAGVTLALTEANTASTTTDTQGNYRFDGLKSGRYSVTPSKQGYVFDPTSISGNNGNVNLTGMDFKAKATHSLSGTISTTSGAAQAGVTLTLSGDASATTTSGQNGSYTFSGLADGTYTITPSLAHFSFAPASINVTLSGADKQGQDFTAQAVLAISGKVTGTVTAGVTITLSGAAIRTTTTDNNGNYTFTQLPSGDYTLTPSLSGYVFSPTSLLVHLIDADVTASNFKSTQHTGPTYAISGKVSLNGKGEPGVGLALFDPVTNTTSTALSGTDGSYRFAGLPTGSYNVTPSKGAYTFNPQFRTVVISSADATGMDFDVLTYWISGRVDAENFQGVPGVSIAIAPAVVSPTTTDQGGNYVLQGVPNGTYTLTPSRTGGSTLFKPTTLEVTVADQGQNGQNFTATIAATVTGKIQYTGARRGRVYLQLEHQEGWKSDHGTSIAGSSFPAVFAVRGVLPGNYRIVAYLDALGVGFPHVVNPSGSSLTFALSTQDVDAGTITLTDPQLPSPTPPGGLVPVPFDKGIFVMLNPPTDQYGNPLAEAMNVYWSTSPNVSPTNTTGGGRQEGMTVQRNFNGLTLSKLTNGSTYYFVANSTMGGLTSTTTSVAGPVTVGAPATGYKVSGQITFSGFTPSGNVWAAAVKGIKGDGPEAIYVALLPVTGASMPYSIHGVPDGDYGIYILVDMNGNGLMERGDLLPNDQTAGRAHVAGADATADVQVEAQPIVTWLATDHTRDGQNDWYQVSLRLQEGLKFPVRAVITQAPGMITPRDLGRREWGFESWTSRGSERPSVGEAYMLDLEFSDGSTGSETATVQRVLDSFATPVAPMGTVPGQTHPTFQWNAPASPPASYSYQLSVWRDNGFGGWWSNDISAGQTSAVYNFDGQAQQDPLTSGAHYFWQIVVQDELKNTCRAQADFTP